MRRLFALAFLAAACAGHEARAQGFYEGKTINLISGASGGYDSYTRLLANHLGKHIAGKPHVVVRAMPGAASMAAANHIYNVAAPDGLTFGSFVRAIPLAPLLGDTAARYDPVKFAWIGSASSYLDDAYLLIVRKDLGVASIDDLRRRATPLRLGSTGPSSEADVGARVIGKTLGLKLELVRGYQGTPQIALAVERGEMDGMMLGVSSMNSARAEWLGADPPVRFLFQFGYGGAGRHPRFPDAPRVDELARTDDERAIFMLMQLPFRMARPFAAPPGLPDDRRRALEDGFMRAHADADLLADARKMGLDVSPEPGVKIAELIRDATKLPRGLIDRYIALLAE